MNINTVSNNTVFKSVYPVYHWTKTENIWCPTADYKAAQKMQRKLLGILNKTIPNRVKQSHNPLQLIADYIAKNDRDYANFPHVRSYYDKNGGYIIAKDGTLRGYRPFVYLITGQDAENFTRRYGEPIGRSKGNIKFGQNEDSLGLAALCTAQQDYFRNGFIYVKQMSKRFFLAGDNSNSAGLHTIFSGNSINDMNMINCRFFTEKSPENPLSKFLNNRQHG